MVTQPQSPTEPRPSAKIDSRPLLRQPRVVRLLIIALLAEIGYAVLNISTMPVYLAWPIGNPHQIIPDGRNLGPAVIGLVLVAFLTSEAVFKSPMGALADRFGPRNLMLAGPCITACTSLATVFVPANWGVSEIAILIVLRIADGIGAAMLWPAAFALMGDIVKDEERQQGMSHLNLCYMLGIALAPLIGGFANDETGHKWASLVLTSGIFVALALAVARFIPKQPTTHHSESEGEGIGLKDLLQSVQTIPLYLILAVVTFMGIGFPMVVVKLFAQQEFGMSELGFGGMVFPAALAMAAFTVPLARFGERMGKANAVHFGLALCTFGLAFICLGSIIPVFREPWAIAAGGVPVGMGFLLAIPAWMASVSDIDCKRRGANLGAVMTAQGVGAIIGAPIGSALYEKLVPITGLHFAHYAPFIGCTACIALGWLLSIRLFKGEKPPER